MDRARAAAAKPTRKELLTEIDRLRSVNADMLAALEGIVKCFDPAALENPPESVFVRQRLEAVRTAIAIAKATGATP